MHVPKSVVAKPMWFSIPFGRRVDYAQRFIRHTIGVREITSLTLTTPVQLRSLASQTIVKNKILSTRMGMKSLLEIEFDGDQRHRLIDCRPRLPLVFRF